MKFENAYKILNSINIFNKQQTIQKIDEVKQTLNQTHLGYEKFMTSIIFDKTFSDLSDVEILMILDMHSSLILNNFDVEKNKSAVRELESKVKVFFSDIYDKHLRLYFSNVKKIYSI